MKILYDEKKRIGNQAKHGLDFSDLSVDFFEASVVFPVRTGRFMAIGLNQDRVAIAVVFRPMGREAISVISMRLASRRERESL